MFENNCETGNSTYNNMAARQDMNQNMYMGMNVGC